LLKIKLGHRCYAGSAIIARLRRARWTRSSLNHSGPDEPTTLPIDERFFNGARNHGAQLW